MKNTINDHKHTVSGAAANSSSLLATQNSKQQNQLGRQNQLGLNNQKSLQVSLTPCFSKVWQSITATSTVLTVSFGTRDFRFEISNLKSEILLDFAILDLPSPRFSAFLRVSAVSIQTAIFSPKRPVI